MTAHSSGSSSSGKRRRRRSSSQNAPKNRQNQQLLQLFTYTSIGITAILVLYTRINLLDIPLERDEGGFAYIGKMLIQGKHLYTDLYDNKLPGLYSLYGVFITLFGESARGIHLGLMLFNFGSIALLYFIAKHLFDDFVAGITAISFAVLSLSPGVIGYATHGTQLLLLPGLGGLYLMLLAMESRKLWQFLVSGLLFGLAFIINQHAINLLFFAGGYLFYKSLFTKKSPISRWGPRLGSLVLGGIIPYGIVYLFISASGRLEDFWFWTFKVPVSLLTQLTFKDPLEILFDVLPLVLGGSFLLWLMAIIGFFTTFYLEERKYKKVFALGFLIFLGLGVCAGFRFYQHYFVLVLPAVSLLIGLFLQFILSRAKRKSLKGLAIVLFTIGILQVIVTDFEYFIIPDYDKVLKNSYGNAPFEEAEKIGAFLKDKKKDGDQMIIFGSEPQIAFHADIPLATGDVFMYPMSSQSRYHEKLQQDFKTHLTENPPRFVIFVNDYNSWETIDEGFKNWCKNYTAEGYKMIGLVEIANESVYQFAPISFKPTTVGNTVEIYERQ